MNVLAATKEPLVFDTLNQAEQVENVVAALYTGRIYTAIPETQLAIVDYADLVPHPFSEEAVRRLIENAPMEQCSSDEFLLEPERYLRASAPRRRSYELPRKLTIAFTSYSGGTGKTSLSLDTALHFAAQTKSRMQLPTAVFEFGYGSSALDALVRDQQSDVYDLITQPELEPYDFHGVSLYPMNYDRIRDTSIDQVARYLNTEISHYVLTVIDTIWPHGMVQAIGDAVDIWFVLTTPRIDAVENARRLRRELSEEYGDDKVQLIGNQMGGLGTTLALLGLEREIEVKQLSESEVFFGGRLRKQVLTQVYNSLWHDYEHAGRRRWRLFRRR